MSVAALLATIPPMPPVPWDDWPWFVAGAFMRVALLAFPHAKQAYFRWRLESRLARDSFMLREEWNERNNAIGENLEPIDWRVASFEVIVSGCAMWLLGSALHDWLDAALIGMGVLGLLVGFWRKLNDPPASVAEADSDHDSDPVGIGKDVNFLATMFLIAMGVMIGLGWLL